MLARDSSPMISSKMAALLHSPTPVSSSPLAGKTSNANQFQSKLM
jgi:hypothetical protein